LSANTNNNTSPQKQEPKKFRIPWWTLAFLALLLSPLLIKTFSHTPEEISWQEFRQNLLDKNSVEKIVVVNDEFVEIYVRDSTQNEEELTKGPQYLMTIGSVESFERKLDEAEQELYPQAAVPITYSKKTSWFSSVLSWVIPLIILVMIWQFFFRRMATGGAGGTSVFSFGKSTAQLLEKENRSIITFDDVAGLDEAKMEVRETVEFLKTPESFTRLGAKIPKGVILVGPPGTGKTLLAKAVAGEAQVPFFSISGSEFVEMFVGVGASRVRDLFRQAKEKAPCIIFIDEIDAIGRSRGKSAFYTGANDERESTLNQLLTEMDGFGTNSGVIILAATNRADMLDQALIRPGRFDRHIYLELPNLVERTDIFKVHLRPLVLDNTIDIHFLASQTPGFSGADIANICNEAALIAARKKKDKVGRQDFLDAIDRTVAGLEKKSKIITPDEKKIIAYHEAGHAVISWLLKHIDPLVKVSIIPRGKSLGAAWYLPEERQLKTASAFHDHLCAMLGGRAAEEIIFREVSSGALDDLEKVTREAYMMIAFYGFNKKVGNISFYDSTGTREGFQKPYSEETAALIDEEVRQLVSESYEQAKTILRQNKISLTKVAELLLEKEVIFKDDLVKILGERSTGNGVPQKKEMEKRTPATVTFFRKKDNH
jgi:AFG3 family protein